MTNDTINVGDIVYEKRRGWSSVALVVLKIFDRASPDGTQFKVALCEHPGWPAPNPRSYGNETHGHPGLWSEEWQTYVSRYALGNLSKECGNAI